MIVTPDMVKEQIDTLDQEDLTNIYELLSAMKDPNKRLEYYRLIIRSLTNEEFVALTYGSTAYAPLEEPAELPLQIRETLE